MRRRRRRSRIVISLVIVVAAAGGAWWLWPRGGVGPSTPANGGAGRAQSRDDLTVSGVPEAVIAADVPTNAKPDEVLTPLGSGDRATPITAREGSADSEAPANDEETAQGIPSQPEETATPPEDSGERLSSNPRINASLQRYQAGEVLIARQELNRMLAISRSPAEQAELRRHLRKIADATVFSKGRIGNDPLTEMYTIQSGDYLINVGRQFGVPYEVIMLINGIEVPARIRAGQIVKVPRGPFNAKIHTSEYRLDVYLQDLYVRSFPVGLGAERGTPIGTWRVKERLTNPTYYPPTSAPIKRIIPPDDPANPLGERWIGLEGTAGDARGRTGYGIHGTIEPDSVGKAVSLGCVRMHNRDVEFLYKLLLPGHSTVTTLP